MVARPIIEDEGLAARLLRQHILQLSHATMFRINGSALVRHSRQGAFFDGGSSLWCLSEDYGHEVGRFAIYEAARMSGFRCTIQAALNDFTNSPPKIFYWPSLVADPSSSPPFVQIGSAKYSNHMFRFHNSSASLLCQSQYPVLL